MTAFDAVRFAVAAILFTAAVLKTHQLATEPPLGTSLLESRWFLVCMVQFELFLAFWLAVGVWLRCAYGIAIATFSLFAVVAATKGISGEASCGCFGRIPTSPWLALTIDGCTVFGLLVSRDLGWKRWARSAESDVLHVATPSGRMRRAWTWTACVVATWLVAAVGLGVVALRGLKSDTLAAIGHRVGHLIIVEPDRMPGQSFEMGKYIDIGHQIARGRWVVVLHRTNCPVCEQLISNWEVVAQKISGDTRVAFVSVPPHAPGPGGAPAGVVVGVLTPHLDWFVSTPIVVSVCDNKVLAVVDGSLPALLEKVGDFGGAIGRVCRNRERMRIGLYCIVKSTKLHLGMTLESRSRTF